MFSWRVLTGLAASVLIAYLLSWVPILAEKSWQKMSASDITVLGLKFNRPLTNGQMVNLLSERSFHYPIAHLEYLGGRTVAVDFAPNGSFDQAKMYADVYHLIKVIFKHIPGVDEMTVRVLSPDKKNVMIAVMAGRNQVETFPGEKENFSYEGFLKQYFDVTIYGEKKM